MYLYLNKNMYQKNCRNFDVNFENETITNQSKSTSKEQRATKFFVSVLNVFYVLCLPLSSIMVLFSPMVIYNNSTPKVLLMFFSLLCVPISLAISLFKMQSSRSKNEYGKVYFFGVLPIITFFSSVFLCDFLRYS